MTLLAAPSRPQTETLRLTEAEAGFWVAARDGAFAGTIDRQGDHFYARDCFGRYLGDYPDRDTAAGELRARTPYATA